MQTVFLGEYIKQRRLALNLTQEQLCEGICKPITISRLENGKQVPSYSRMRTILQRLGICDDRYFALLGQSDAKIEMLREEILADSIRFKRASDEARPAIQSKILGKLTELEQTAKPDDQMSRQFILSCRASIGDYGLEERLEMQMEALQLTVPGIDLENIQLCLLSIDETTLLNQIAVTYAAMGQRKKGIDIYRQLFKYVQEHYQELSRYAGHLSLIAHNYAIDLLLEKRYEEAVEVAELGRKACVEYGHYQVLPGLLDILGCCYFYVSNYEKCKEYYQCAYYIYKAIGNEHDRELLKKAAKEQLNLEFPY